MSIFKGSGVAIVTPLKEDLSVDFDMLGNLIDFQIANETDAIVTCGTTGEPSTLTEEEQLAVIGYTVSKVKGRIPVIAGASSNNTHHAVKLAKESQRLGADAVLIATPYYNKTTQRGLVLHYTEIAKHITIPIILYNVPSRTGLNLLPSTVYELSKIQNITAVKEASGNINQIAELANLVYGKMDIYSGNDDHTVPVLSLGGIGVISVSANIIPKDTHDMVMSFLSGDIDRARDLQLKAVPLVAELFREVSPSPIKRALRLMGMNVGSCRMPLCEMEEVNVLKLIKAMKDYGLTVVTE